jgi:hypothetical protein
MVCSLENFRLVIRLLSCGGRVAGSSQVLLRSGVGRDVYQRDARSKRS